MCTKVAQVPIYNNKVCLDETLLNRLENLPMQHWVQMLLRAFRLISQTKPQCWSDDKILSIMFNFAFKGTVPPTMKVKSLSPHPNADGKSGKVSISTKDFWSFIVKQCGCILLINWRSWGLLKHKTITENKQTNKHKMLHTVHPA